MDTYLRPAHRELSRRLEAFGARIELVDSVCEDAKKIGLQQMSFRKYVMWLRMDVLK